MRGNQDMKILIRVSKKAVSLLEENDTLPQAIIEALRECQDNAPEPEHNFFSRTMASVFNKEEIANYKREILRQARLVIQGRFQRADDFTFYVRRKPGDAFEHLLNPDNDQAKAYSLDCKLDIEEGMSMARGRVLVCSCFRGSYWSMSFRKEEGPETGTLPQATELTVNGGYRATVDHTTKDGRKLLSSICDLCDVLYQPIFSRGGGRAQGLIVVTGRTASAKSQIARGLIHRYLDLNYTLLRSGGRNPHLLTFEDPIETYFFDAAHSDPNEAQDCGLDYTARQKGEDFAELTGALNDPLRQNPEVVFVGETRQVPDWQSLIEFAGTGHLVFTTAHAGSLTEAMGKIFEATSAEKPSARSVVADRILALVHVRQTKIGVHSVLVPALWRQTPGGTKALMAEGRAALLPHNPKDEDSSKSSLGRQWFARKLLEKRKGTLRNEDQLRNEVMARAIEWDIEGV